MGDLTILGWVVFLAYFGVAALCYWAANVCWQNRVARKSCRVWIAIAGILLLLGVNKQLDLHVWLNAFGRQLAEAEGWYQNREFAQVVFFGGVAVVAVAACLLLIGLGWGDLRTLSGALLGVGSLAAFLLIRAISFDVIDLRTYIGGFKLHEILEVLGILLIGVSAVVYSRSVE